MKLLVIMDDDGHFKAAHPTDREATLKLLKEIHDGDYYDETLDLLDLSDISSNLNEYCCQQWSAIIDDFLKKGTVEYVEISDIVPVGCKCENSSK